MRSTASTATGSVSFNLKVYLFCNVDHIKELHLWYTRICLYSFVWFQVVLTNRIKTKQKEDFVSWIGSGWGS
jgi:hypothetical protein